MAKDFETLRNEYRRFTYEGFNINSTSEGFKLTFNFEIDKLAKFSPAWLFNLGGRNLTELMEDKVFRRAVFNLGMAELVSYWKITCAPEVVIKAGRLNTSQLEWWKKQYYYGLGEFFYLNGIKTNMKSLMRIQADTFTNEDVSSPDMERLQGCLIPVGGGKDSITTLELLRERFDSNYCYVINPRGATEQSVLTAGYPQERQVYVKRTLDERMLELNKEGYLNGHTPFSVIVAFSALLAAYIYKRKYVVLSNESSANEPTVLDSDINHQYSKGFEFEKDFTLYEKEYIGSGVTYFSLLRPLSEYQIASFFAKQEKYHKVFRSCNVGSKNDCWCGTCPKCLFVCIILSAFLDNGRLIEIFGRDMLNSVELKGTFDKLIGVCPEKPFECVGSRDEVNTAVCEAIKRFYHDSELPLLYRYYAGTEQYKNFIGRRNLYESYFDVNHLVPKDFINDLKGSYKGGKETRIFR